MTKDGKTFAYSYGADGVRTQKTVDGVTTEYYTVGGKLLAEKTGDQVLTFHYDEKGTPYALELNGTRYYYRYSLQGDVIGLYSTTGAVVAEYTYDPWGKLLSITDTSGTDIGALNPLRYRGYYYDTETGFYFLQSRYYDPTVGRFVNADGQLSGVGGDMQGYNLFAYCGNDPINRSDPTGEAWWHWVLAGAVVVGCAVATVITAGGFAAAVAAVSAVGSGFAASTAAATISAGAFLGSATALGSAMMLAGTSSNTLSDFADFGDWGTVASTAFGAAFGGLEGYCISRAQRPARKPTTNGKSRGSTGRTEPTNLAEQLAMEQVKSNPSAGTQLLNIKLNDPRWPSCEGWVKMQQTVPTSQGKINIHYVFNEIIMIYDDFKFK